MNIFKRFRPDPVDPVAAEEALTRAKEAHAAAKEQRSEVDKVANSLRRLREENHFAQAVREWLIAGGHK